MWFRQGTTFRTKRARRRHFLRSGVRAGLAAFAVALLISGVAYGARRDALNISAIVVVGDSAEMDAVVRREVEEALAGTYFFLIPRSFSYLYPQEAIEEQLRAIPRIQSASVARSSRNELKVSFRERSPFALWCRSVHEPGPCVFIDEEGFAYDEAPSLSGTTFVRYAIEGGTPAIGAAIYGEDLLDLYRRFSVALEERYRLRTVAVALDHNRDTTFVTNAGTRIIIAEGADIQTVFDNLDSIFTSEEFKDVSPHDLEYIDLRFGNKVFIKEPSAATTTEDGAGA